MFHNRSEIIAPSLKAIRATAIRKYVIVGNFPLTGNNAASSQTQLVYLLNQSGGHVTTVSATGPSAARIPLRFKTRRLWKKTLTNIDRVTGTPFEAILYPAGLGQNLIDKPRWQSRRMEEWRRLKLAAIVAARADKCTIIFDRATPWFSLLMLIATAFANPFSIRVNATREAPEGVFKQITGKPSIPVDVELAQAITLQIGRGLQADKVLLGLRQQANKLEQMTPPRPKLAADLRWIHEVSLRLKRAPDTLLPNNADSVMNVDKVALANIIPPKGRLSLFMQHYRDSPGTGAPNDDESSFIDWYVHAPINRKTSVPLPIPTEILHYEFNGSEGSSPDALYGPLSRLPERIEYGCPPQSTEDRGAFLCELIFDLAQRCETLKFLPASLLDYFREELGHESGNISRMELLCFALRPPQTGDDPLPLWQSGHIRNWFACSICKNAPAMGVFSTKPRPYTAETTPHAVQITGITQGQSGLARNAMMSVDALNIENIPTDVGNRPFNKPWLHNQAASGRPLNMSVTLHHVNAESIPRQILAAGQSLHIGFLLWEFEKLPKSHLLAGQMLDEVWVPSEYVRKIYEPVFDCKVVNVGKGFSLPEIVTSDMCEYGVTARHHVFLMCFDAHSSIERKNPLAAVEAFLIAFPKNADVRLVIKTTPVSPSHWGDPNGQMRKIRRIAQQDSRIIIDDRMLPFNALLSLIKRADCILSPHRAEGFGYIPAYALWFARPVIATGYSGTLDICTESTADLIAYNLITTRANETIEPLTDAKWADIDISALAQAMYNMFEDSSVATLKAQEGRRLLRTKYTPEMQARRYLDRLISLGVITG